MLLSCEIHIGVHVFSIDPFDSGKFNGIHLISFNQLMEFKIILLGVKEQE